MAKVYKDNSAFTITVSIGTDLTSANAVRLDVLKPNTTTAEQWAASASTTSIVCTVDGSTREVDVAGEYVIMPYIDDLAGDGSGFTGYCDTVRMVVYDTGE